MRRHVALFGSLIPGAQRRLTHGVKNAAARSRRGWVVLFSLCLCAGMLLGAGRPAVLAAPPVAENGVIDLSGWVPSKDGVIRLQGEWEFYWQALIDPEEFAAGLVPVGSRHLEKVPGKWSQAKHGFATYRLRILNADAFGPLALYIPYEQSAYRLWIDGRLMAQNGEVGTDRATSRAEYLPAVVRFHPPPGQDEVELVIQVSNYDFRLGGLWNSPLLGPEQRLERVIYIRALRTALLSGAFLAVAIYHIAFSLFRRGTDAGKSALALAVLSLSIATRAILMGERVFGLAFPDFSWSWQLRFEYLTGYSAVLAMAVYLACMFPSDTPRFVLRAAALSALIGGGITVIAPVRVSSEIMPYVILLDAVLVVCFLGVAVRAFVCRREGGAWLFAGGVVFGATSFLDFLYYNRLIESVNTMPFGFFGLVLFQMFILGQQFANAFRMQAKLLRDLQRSSSLIAELHERERREVAEFLHGRVQNRLILIRERLKEVKKYIEQQDPRAQESTQSIHDEVLEVQNRDIRRASHLLHPSAIEVGLIPAVRDLAASYEGAFKVTVNADGALIALDEESALGMPGSGPTLPRSLRICLYRIVEECLGNARKHSGAKHVDIDFRLAGNTIQLTIAGAGRGFPANPAPSEGLGLKIVDARVREAGGTWSIASHPLGGAVIQVTIPLEPPDYELPPLEPVKGAVPESAASGA